MTFDGSLVDQLRLLRDWMPMLSYGQRWLSETDPHARTIIVGEAVEWMASKTTNKLDDEIVSKVVAVLKTAEGEALVRLVVRICESFMAEQSEVQK